MTAAIFTGLYGVLCYNAGLYLGRRGMRKKIEAVLKEYRAR